MSTKTIEAADLNIAPAINVAKSGMFSAISSTIVTFARGVDGAHRYADLTNNGVQPIVAANEVLKDLTKAA